MQKARYWIVLTFMVLAFVSLHSLAFAIYEFCGVNHLFSLQGLEGVQVNVIVDYEIGSELPELSHSYQLRQITTDVEEKLRKEKDGILGWIRSKPQIQAFWKPFRRPP